MGSQVRLSMLRITCLRESDACLDGRVVRMSDSILGIEAFPWSLHLLLLRADVLVHWYGLDNHRQTWGT